MAFSAIVSVWATAAERYNLLRVVQNPTGTDLTIQGEISPMLRSEMKAVLLQLCDGTNTVAGRADILLDALDDLVVTDLDDNIIASQAAISDANTTITLSIAGSVTQTKKTVRVVMPQTLVGIYAGANISSPGDILLQTGVIPGTYSNPTITVRADGRIAVATTNASSGSLGPGAITETYLATDAVTTAKVADAAITDAKIADVDVSKVTGLAAAYLAADAVLATANLGSNIVTTVKVADGAVTADKIAAGAVATAKLADGAVTGAKIADGTISNAKISGVSASKVSGLADVATSGSYADLIDAPAAFSGAYADLTGTPDLTGYLSSSSASATYATKSEVAAIQQGVFYKQSCATRVSSTSAASTYLAANQSARVLVDSGTAAVANGIYVYDATTGFRRAADFDGDPVSEISPGAMVYVVDSGVAYVCNSSAAPTVVNGAITSTTSWTIYSKAEVLTASNGISRSGNALSLDPTAATFKAAVPYDIGLDYTGRPTLNENMLEVTLPRAITLGAPASHYVKTLVSGERPAANNGSVITVYRNSTIVLTISYQTNGTAVVAEPGSTVRSFAAGDVLKMTCTVYDSAAKNHKVTLTASLA